MKHFFYASLILLIVSVVLFLNSCCTTKITADEKKAGVILRGKKHILYKGNLSKYSYFGNRKNKKK